MVPAQDDDLVVIGKADLRDDGAGVSGLTGQGLEWVLAQIGDKLQNRIAGLSSMSRRRQRAALENALDGVRAARGVMAVNGADEVASEELRRGVHGLEVLIGRVDVEQVLGEIFSSFCIGK